MPTYLRSNDEVSQLVGAIVVLSEVTESPFELHYTTDSSGSHVWTIDLARIQVTEATLVLALAAIRDEVYRTIQTAIDTNMDVIAGLNRKLNRV